MIQTAFDPFEDIGLYRFDVHIQWGRQHKPEIINVAGDVVQLNVWQDFSADLVSKVSVKCRKGDVGEEASRNKPLR